MNEGKFLKLPTQESGNLYAKKGESLSSESFREGFDEIQEEIFSKTSDEALRIKSFEVEKSEEDKRILERSLEAVRNVLRRFGGDHIVVSLPLVHLVKPEYFGKESGELGGEDASYNLQTQFVTVARDNYTTNSKLAIASFHELLHLVSFQRCRLIKSTQENEAEMVVILERNGFDITDKKNPKKTLFYYLTEMVVEKLTKEFTEGIRVEDFFKEEFDYLETQLAERSLERPLGGYMELGLDSTGQEVWHLGEAYVTEVKRFQEMLAEIVNKNSELTLSEEVFDIFAQGLFSGHLLKIARLLEKTYGKGAFRILGEMTAHQK